MVANGLGEHVADNCLQREAPGVLVQVQEPKIIDRCEWVRPPHQELWEPLVQLVGDLFAQNNIVGLDHDYLVWHLVICSLEGKGHS